MCFDIAIYLHFVEQIKQTAKRNTVSSPSVPFSALLCLSKCVCVCVCVSVCVHESACMCSHPSATESFSLGLSV